MLRVAAILLVVAVLLPNTSVVVLAQSWDEQRSRTALIETPEKGRFPKDHFGAARDEYGISTTSTSATEARTCLALNIYHEARNEMLSGRIAVGQVVLNRVKHPDFPDTVCGVVKQGGERLHRCQFSWYCDGKSDRPYNITAWRDAHALATLLLEGRNADPSRGALFYHSIQVSPGWAEKMQVTARIGSHIFYRKGPFLEELSYSPSRSP